MGNLSLVEIGSKVVELLFHDRAPKVPPSSYTCYSLLALPALGFVHFLPAGHGLALLLKR